MEDLASFRGLSRAKNDGKMAKIQKNYYKMYNKLTNNHVDTLQFPPFYT